MAPPKRVVAVVNPATRTRPDTGLSELRKQLPAGTELAIVYTTGQPMAFAELGVTADTACVIAIGGDGTVAEVSSALGGRNVPLGIIPAGSTNVIARNLGVPMRTADAAKLIFGQHRIANIDVGLCGERRFLHMAGSGFDSYIFDATNPALKRRIGWLAYLPAALGAFRKPPSRFRITVDGARVDVRSTFVLVANGNFVVHPMLSLFRDIRSDDGRLDVLIFTATSPLAYLRTVSRFLTRTLGRSPYVMRLTGSQVTIDASPAMPVELDGDVHGTTPRTFSVEPRGLRVIVPSASNSAE